MCLWIRIHSYLYKTLSHVGISIWFKSSINWIEWCQPCYSITPFHVSDGLWFFNPALQSQWNSCFTRLWIELVRRSMIWRWREIPVVRFCTCVSTHAFCVTCVSLPRFITTGALCLWRDSTQPPSTNNKPRYLCVIVFFSIYSGMNYYSRASMSRAFP